MLITLELFHPANFTRDPGMSAYLSHPEHYSPHHFALGYFRPDWWFALHMIQTPMVCLVAIRLWRLLAPVGAADGPLATAAAWLARVSVFAFLSIVVLQGMIADKSSRFRLDGICSRRQRSSHTSSMRQLL